MSKTTQLQKLMKAQMDTVSGETFYVFAKDNATFPYKVFAFQSADLGDITRDDLIMTVDIWDKGPNQRAIDEIADQLETLFNASNIPQETILPTIWRESRYLVPDDNKNIRHIQMTFYIQNYERI